MAYITIPVMVDEVIVATNALLQQYGELGLYCAHQHQQVTILSRNTKSNGRD